MVLLPADGAARIESWGASWGFIDIRRDSAEDLLVISGISQKEALRLPTQSAWQSDHFLRHADQTPRVGPWYEVDATLHEVHRQAMLRGGLSVSPDLVRQAVQNGWRFPPVDAQMPVLTWSPVQGGVALWSMWWISKDAATPGALEVVTDTSPLTDLADAWPVDDLRAASVVIVGLGSIGSVVAETLASYAVGHLTLVDPDRLLRHNLVRHRLGRRDIGRLKVNAMANLLQDRYPDVQIERHPINVIYDADLMRPLFAHADLVIGATDGVASRRVINHLARRAQVPAVLACVLEDGALGEVVRVRPGTGCLLCYRAKLEADGSMDPEPDLDQDYSLGSHHLPMTAVAGDLATVGTLAGKVAVATLLERRGRWAQRLPGDVALIGLQPVPDLPAPFDLERAAEVRWSHIGPSSIDCPTCAAA